MEELKSWGNFFAKYDLSDISEEHIAVKNTIINKNIEGHTVLDIGSGTGNYSIALSDIFDHITSIDISMDCKTVLQHKLLKKDISNVSPVCANYHDTTQKADISFLSMSPVIQTKEDILKIEERTNNAIVLYTSEKGSIDTNRMALLKLLPPKRVLGFIKSATWVREVLSELGRDYEEEDFFYTNEKLISVEDALEYYQSYFEVLGYSKEESTPIIESYLSEHQVDGKILEKKEYKKCLFTWKK